MPDKLFGNDSNLGQLVDESFKQWQQSRQQSARGPGDSQVFPYIAISRVIAGDVDHVAGLIGRKLGWPVFDKEILQGMAGNDDVRRQIYESMDERDLSWLEEATRAFVETGFDRNDYFPRLVNAIFALARGSSAVFVGRGAGWILPQNMGIRVRLVTSPETNAKNYAASEKLDLETARKQVALLERERVEFVKHHFRIDVNDPREYDLTVNLDRFSAEQAAELVVAAHKVRIKT